MLHRLKHLAKRAVALSKRRKLPLRGWPGGQPIPGVDGLDDRALTQLNALLPWNCFVVDAHGRRFGNVAWSTKRTEPQVIPDPRILEFHRRFGLAGKSVVEIGCFEGIHTIALCRLAARVTAIDSRIDNVAKTSLRCTLFGHAPTVRVCDIERVPADAETLRADLCHHVGVLYHLRDPVAHLLDLGRWVGEGIMLDTHFAEPDEATERYCVGGAEWAYKRYGEYGEKDPFSGMYDHAKWLTLDGLRQVLASAGFAQVEVIEQRAERNGARALLYARRNA